MKRSVVVLSFLLISAIFLNAYLILRPAHAADEDERLASLMAGTWRSKDIGNYPIKIEAQGKNIIAKLLPFYVDDKVGMTKELPLLNGVVASGSFVGTYYHLCFGKPRGVKIECVENVNSKIVISSDGRSFEMALAPGVGPVKFVKD